MSDKPKPTIIDFSKLGASKPITFPTDEQATIQTINERWHDRITALESRTLALEELALTQGTENRRLAEAVRVLGHIAWNTINENGDKTFTINGDTYSYASLAPGFRALFELDSLPRSERGDAEATTT